MDPIPTKIAGCYRVRPQIIADSRGHFANLFDLAAVRRVDPEFTVVRMNRSLSKVKGTIRGLHFQRSPKAEDKLVQCLQGAIYDVCVDMRPGSPTYLQWVGAELSADNQELFLVPKGCAHGIQTLRENCLVEYLVSEDYSPAHEGGVRWDDPALGIPWPLSCALISEKDAAWPPLTR